MKKIQRKRQKMEREEGKWEAREILKKAG